MSVFVRSFNDTFIYHIARINTGTLSLVSMIPMGMNFIVFPPFLFFERRPSLYGEKEGVFLGVFVKLFEFFYCQVQRLLHGGNARSFGFGDLAQIHTVRFHR